jgi:hypothetical protein
VSRRSSCAPETAGLVRSSSRDYRLLTVRRQSSLLENQPVFNSSRLAAWLRRVRDAGINARVLVDVSVVATPGEAKLLERIPRFNRRWGSLNGSGMTRAPASRWRPRSSRRCAGHPPRGRRHLLSLGGDPAPALAVLDRMRWVPRSGG